MDNEHICNEECHKAILKEQQEKERIEKLRDFKFDTSHLTGNRSYL